MIEETRRLNRVVSQFLDYARPWRGDELPLSVSDVIEKRWCFCARFSTSSPRRCLMVSCCRRFSLNYSPTCRFCGRCRAASSGVLNLALNAVQAMATKPDGVLTISTGCCQGVRLGSAQQSIEIRFQDRGTGIDPQAMKNLFIPFSPPKNVAPDLTPISQRIVENHGGFHRSAQPAWRRRDLHRRPAVFLLTRDYLRAALRRR